MEGLVWHRRPALWPNYTRARLRGPRAAHERIVPWSRRRAAELLRGDVRGPAADLERFPDAGSRAGFSVMANPRIKSGAGPTRGAGTSAAWAVETARGLATPPKRTKRRGGIGEWPMVGQRRATGPPR